jgi:hypothetical protein
VARMIFQVALKLHRKFFFNQLKIPVDCFTKLICENSVGSSRLQEMVVNKPAGKKATVKRELPKPQPLIKLLGFRVFIQKGKLSLSL